MAQQVYVGNLPIGIHEYDLEDEFSRYGRLRSVWVARKPPGFAFLEYEDVRDARDAVARMDGYRGWRVELSKKGPRGGRGRSPPARRHSLTPPRRSSRRSPSYDRARQRGYDSRSPPPRSRRDSRSPLHRSRRGSLSP